MCGGGGGGCCCGCVCACLCVCVCVCVCVQVCVRVYVGARAARVHTCMHVGSLMYRDGCSLGFFYDVVLLMCL